MADLILDPPEAYPHKKENRFGKKCKTFYIAGPNVDKQMIKYTQIFISFGGRYDWITRYRSKENESYISVTLPGR
jgi:hypothetical protein